MAEVNKMIFALVLVCICFGTQALSLKYDAEEAHRSVLLSAQAFCDKGTFLTKEWYNSTAGFQATYVTDDKEYDATGYVGYLPSEESIYVVYRGSEGWQNWMANLEFTMRPYTSFHDQCEDCKVHKGFYNALLADFDAVEEAVKSLVTQFPSYKVKTTGHSLGAALSQLAALELVARGVQVHSTYNFGQPRTGNAALASFATPLVPTFREVHYRDPVPHVPPEIFGYKHICYEVYDTTQNWENKLDFNCGKSDNDICEDDNNTCMGQWRDVVLNPDDHMTYVGVYIKCY